EAADAWRCTLAAELRTPVDLHLGATPPWPLAVPADGATVLPLGRDDHRLGWMRVGPRLGAGPSADGLAVAAADQIAAALGRAGLARGIEREADRLNRVVDNLLDLSRIEAGALRPRTELHPLSAIVDDAVGRLVDRRDHELVVDVPDDLPPVPVDYVQIEQVL